MCELISVAVAVTGLALIEAASIARAIALKSGQRIDGNQEFIGQGLSNLLAREENTPVEEPCDGVQLVRKSVEHYLTLAAQRHSSLDFVVEAQVRLDVAPALFSIVVDNLVRNAVAHTEAGRVSVHLYADRLVVSDTGIGIEAEEIGRVFQRYYRGAASSGSGIGLSLVKRICDRQGWQIELVSRTGGGTSATLKFIV